MAVDPVCGMTIDESTAEEMGVETVVYRGTTYYFCCPYCRKQFERDPEKYLQAPGAHHDETHGAGPA
ncbi:YHS domain-containing protein [Thermaerobacter marianensis DSM 12885]|uniref:YHS domain-containing protein n=1 Tax=Thermaerobacter marianensis (strain ATCC 700841 / DSM 12885 / JCM 10246 / 7p75a) TaxID=644966 RepID=E6SGX8_THEM7|nr:YHS domain-containing protein [Thermaerobacter marianensis DSM 12885]